MEFFPAIVSKARTMDVLVNGMAGRSESLVLVGQLIPPIHPSLLSRWYGPSGFLISLTTDSVCLFARVARRMQMYEELHVMSPVVPTREFCFLRYCRQIEHGLWAIADISVDLPQRDARFGAPPSRSCRLPSGCLIADMADGSSKVL
jgi:homeobox-leucine zipper protein